MTVLPQIARRVFPILALCGMFAAAASPAVCAEPQQKPKLFVALPDYCPTPDGMAVAPNGDLIVACPNYADTTQPACLIRIDSKRKVSKWVDVPVFAETGRACPMGIEFGPDGDLYVCDNQNWADGNGKQGEVNQGRILRLKIRGNKVVQCIVVVDQISHPNGVRVRGDSLYFTVSMLPKVKRDDGLLTSAVYSCKLDDAGIHLTNTLADKNLLVSFVTLNPDCQYGVDGLAFDSKGNLFVGNFGDGALHKVTFDAKGKVTGNAVFAKTDCNTPMSAPDFQKKMVLAKMRTTDGIFIDKNDNIYVADFSNNAVDKVDPTGKITVLAQSADGDGSDGGLDQPGEPIVWQGKLIVTNFDKVTGPDKVNTKHDKPYTISVLELK